MKEGTQTYSERSTGARGTEMLELSFMPGLKLESDVDSAAEDAYCLQCA